MKVLVLAILVSIPSLASALTVNAYFACNADKDLLPNAIRTAPGRHGTIRLLVEANQLCVDSVTVETVSAGASYCPFQPHPLQQQCQSQQHSLSGILSTFSANNCAPTLNKLLEEILPGQNCQFGGITQAQQQQQQ